MNNEKLTKHQKEGIVRWLVENCEEAGKFSDTKRIYCGKKYRNRCDRNGNLWTDYAECPKECPHHPDNNHIECDGKNCATIKHKVREIEKSINEIE